MNVRPLKNRLKSIKFKSFVQAYLITLLLFALLLAPTFYFYNQSTSRIYRVDNVPTEYTKNILVLGAGIDDGQPGQYLVDRLFMTRYLYEKYDIDRIILSGDNGEKYHNQTDIMHETMVQEFHISETLLFDDPLGLRTYDSCARLKEVYGITKAVIVTQQFHLYRAIKICNELGVDAVGVSADMRDHYDGSWIYTTRELFARHKALIDLYVLTPEYSTELAQ